MPEKGSELSEPAEVSSWSVHGISTFEHEECQKKKNFDPLEQWPICQHEHVLKMGKNNLKKTW